jgi:formyl-CoA transferase
MDETGKAGVLCGRVNGMPEMIGHPQVGFRDLLTPLDVPGAGPLLHPRLGVRLSGAASRLRTPAPRPGEHNEEVYAELLGVPPEELERLRRDGVI